MKNDNETCWVATVSADGSTYVPEERNRKQVQQYNYEADHGDRIVVWNTKEGCQQQCDYLNSM